MRFFIFFFPILLFAESIFDIDRANVWITLNHEKSYSYHIPNWSKEVTINNTTVNLLNDVGATYNIQGVNNPKKILINSLEKAYPIPNNDFVNGSIVGLSKAQREVDENLSVAKLLIEPNSGEYNKTIEIRFTLISSSSKGYILDWHFQNSPNNTHTFLPNNQSFSIYLAKNGTHKLYYGLQGQQMKSATFIIKNSDSKRDSDGDGIPDIWEIENGFNPFESNSNLVDSDKNGWSDFDEILRDGNLTDSDGDGWSDWDEILRGTDPKNSKGCIDKPTTDRLYGVEYKLKSKIYQLDYNLTTGIYNPNGTDELKSPLERFSLIDTKSSKLFDSFEVLNHQADDSLCQIPTQDLQNYLNGDLINLSVRVPATYDIVARARENDPFSNSFWIAKALVKSTKPITIKNFYQIFKNSNEIDFKKAFIDYLKINLVQEKSINIDQNSSIHIALLESVFRKNSDYDFTLLLGNPDFEIPFEAHSKTLKRLNEHNITIYGLYEDLQNLKTNFKNELIQQYGGHYDENSEIKLAKYAQSKGKKELNYMMKLLQVMSLKDINDFGKDIKNPDADSDGDGISNDEELSNDTDPLKDENNPTIEPKVKPFVENNSVVEGEDLLVELVLDNPNQQNSSLEYVIKDINTTQDDYLNPSGKIEFKNGSKREYLKIPIINDFTKEGVEEFEIEFKDFQNLSMDNKKIKIAILDNTQKITVSFEQSDYRVYENGNEVDIGVVLSTALEKNVTVSFNFEGNATKNIDYNSSEQITISSRQNIGFLSVRVKNDDVIETLENVLIKIVAVSDGVNISQDKNSTTLSIIDDDYPISFAKIPKTGRKIYLRDFDDGYYKMGEDRNYTIDGEFIINQSTKLVWLDNERINRDEPEMMNWQEAKEYCKNLSNGWRLPTLMELFYLTDKKDLTTNSQRAIDSIFKYKGKIINEFWSLTEKEDFAWIVKFDADNQISLKSKGERLNVRCVKNQSDTLTVFSKLNRDGESNIYDDVNDLNWSDKENATKTIQTYIDSLNYCKNLGYRLPNIFELLSIVNLNKENPAINSTFLPFYDPNSPNSNLFWSSTPLSTLLNQYHQKVWILDSSNGSIVQGDINENYNFRCIKGGKEDNNLGEKLFLNFSSSLWVTDGTVSGSNLIQNDEALDFQRVGNYIYFTANEKLYRGDLKTTSIDIVGDFSGYQLKSFTIVGKTLYFVKHHFQSNSQLWKVEEGFESQEVLDLGILDREPALININNILYLNANLNNLGVELYKYNPTTANLQLLNDIIEGGASSYPANFAKVENKLYFIANHSLYNFDTLTNQLIPIRELNQNIDEIMDILNVDGVIFLVVMQKNGNMAINKLMPNNEIITLVEYNTINWVVIKNNLYFIYDNCIELCKIEKNSEQIQLIAQSEYAYGDLTNFNNNLYFIIAFPENASLCKLKNGDIKRIKIFNEVGTIQIDPQSKTDNNLFFIFRDGANKEFLWKTNIIKDDSILLTP